MRSGTLALVMVFAGLAATQAMADKAHCPPGLAKKAVPCVPPGQVGKKGARVWRPGDRVTGDYVLIPRDLWGRYGLRPYDDGSAYVVVNDEVLRVLLDTLVVIEAVRILTDALD